MKRPGRAGSGDAFLLLTGHVREATLNAGKKGDGVGFRGYRGGPFFKGMFLFRDDAVTGGSVETRHDEGTEEKRERVYYCRECGTTITSRKYSFEMEDQHLHTFLNPSGLIFQISCFSRARGCRVYGSYTAEFSWFPGYEWAIALCRGCGRHMGWHYSSGASDFFGLIMENLAEGEED